ncbi:MAG TPA: DUF1080 domain-containing protein [Thermoguttaceae bacterium]|nr:DUF1080 domain-containing protein [Thermoguttaceae bacterium]
MVCHVYGVRIGLLSGLLLTGAMAAAESQSGHNTLSPAEAAEGWLLLFDGQTLFGWQAAPKEAWQAAEEELRANTGQPAKPAQTTKPHEGGKPATSALLLSTSPWADFLLRMDFRVDPGAQASLGLRTNPDPTAAGKAGADGYELVLASEDPSAWPLGSLKGRKKAAGAALQPGWHTLEARLEAGSIAVQVDGQEVLRYEDPKPIRRGHLALQVQTGSAAFRNIKLRPLGLRSIFTGKDLAGWKTYPQTPTKCTVTPEGYLRVQGGRGQVESEGHYADFTLQLEVFVNGQGLNSGVFFRCIPGESMNGYECQIHNGFVDGDRNKPKDCGTGGIFRRQNARRVVADDFQWLTLTIHANGPHVATWVNGYPTADWTDARPADPNPRKGRRLEAGTLQFQGHDPTTDLMFRNIRVVELPGR